MVGLFFFINDKTLSPNGFLIHTVPLEEAENYGDMKTDFLGHDKLFENTYPDYKGEYYDFSRGRIVYDTVKDEYVIYIDKCIKTESKIRKLKELFQLEGEQVRVEGDLHYVCRKCGKGI